MLGWALNEEANLPLYVERAETFLRSVTNDFELVLIDDGSTDATWALMNELAATRSWLKPMQNPVNRGSGFCYRRAIASASKAHCFAQTVDWSYDITRLGQSLHLLSDFDVLQGIREDTFTPEGLWKRSDNPWKAVVSFVNFGLIRLLFRLPLRDYQNVTICPTQLVQSLPLEANSSFANPEVLLKMWWHGASFVEIPTGFRKRERGTATGTRVRSILRSITEIFGYWCRWVLFNGYPNRKRGRVSRSASLGE